MSDDLRVALFADSYLEANGVARTARSLDAYARSHGRPLLVVHAGPVTKSEDDGSVRRLALERGRASFALEHDLRFDVAFWRHFGRVRTALQEFRPDVLHFTGPSDVGLLGAYLGWRLGLPLVASWHTNLHQYAWRRLAPRLGWLSERRRARLAGRIERWVLALALRFYRLPRAILAPNDDLVALLAAGTGRPTFLMSRGVDANLFRPSWRTRNDGIVNLGYVGRLSPEKDVRVLASIAATLENRARTNVRFTIVGDGHEREWLREHLPLATFLGVLDGEALAHAYADMDVFVFPSETDTVGNVALEAMASGVPVVGMRHGGLKLLGQGASELAATRQELVERTVTLVEDRRRREHLGRLGRIRALTLSWNQIFDEVYQVYALAKSGSANAGDPADDPWTAPLPDLHANGGSLRAS
jgi:glycosyltransferase involved in cell wall biosynthesis